MRTERRRELLRILREGKPSSQTEIVDALRAAGHDVTQATVSRDLHEVGAVKVHAPGGYVYRLPDDAVRASGTELTLRNLYRALAEFAIDIRTAASLVIVFTAPGHAMAVARAIDFAGLDDVVGTVAGDDTIFVATPDPATAQALARRWLTSEAEPAEVGT